MMSWLTFVLILGVTATAVLADSLVAFPEDVAFGSNSRIVSGWPVAEGQIPYQISLRNVRGDGAVSACGGSIISAEWGLTAAHCTANRVTIVIRAGVVNLTLPTYIFETTNYYNHPLYNEAMQGTVQPHDIGLLEFGRSLIFSDAVQPIRLQNSWDKNRNYDGERLTASGWGLTWTQGSGSEIMNWVYQVGVSNPFCRSLYTSWDGTSIVVDSTICAQHYNVTSQSTCQGDSGGLLTIVDADGANTQVGISSFVSSLGCHAGRPAGFIRPGHYHDWFTELTGVDFDWEPLETTLPATETTTTEASTGTTEAESE